MLECSVGREFEDADLHVISDGVLRHGRAQAAGGDAKSLACLVREEGAVIAGASGRTEFGRLFVLYLWVETSRRGQGIGSQALYKLERAAREAGCRDSLIETLNDRVAQLYERLGYQHLAVIPAYVGPFNRHILHKDMAATEGGMSKTA